MKLAIMYGGPVTASIHTYPRPSLNDHDDRDGVFMGNPEGSPSSGGHAIVIFGWGETRSRTTVSYTHLTLPTICSV